MARLGEGVVVVTGTTSEKRMRMIPITMSISTRVKAWLAVAVEERAANIGGEQTFIR